jgi:hypothetical protein
MNLLKTFLLFSLGILLIANASAVMTTYAEFGNDANAITITNGQSITFDAGFYASEPMTINLKMYNTAYSPVKNFFYPEETKPLTTATNPSSFYDFKYSNTYSINPSDYATTGSFQIILSGSDVSGSASQYILYLTVNPQTPPTPPANNLPIINSISDQSINEGTAFSYQVAATDADEDILTYSLPENPGWLSINSATGLITGTAPMISFDTDYDVEVAVSDGTATTYRDFEIEVKNIPTTGNVPVITILGSNPATIQAGFAYTDASATATDAEDGNLTSSIVATSNVNTNVLGTYSVIYSVTDSSSNTVTATRTVNVVASDTTAPVIAILFPSNNGNYQSVSTLQVQITDPNLQSCWYKKNGGSSIFFTCNSGQIITLNANSKSGENVWIVYANDSLGNQNSESVTFDVFGGSNGGSSGGSSGSAVSGIIDRGSQEESEDGIYLTPKTKQGVSNASALLFVTTGIIGLGILLAGYLLFVKLRK